MTKLLRWRKGVREEFADVRFAAESAIEMNKRRNRKREGGEDGVFGSGSAMLGAQTTRGRGPGNVWVNNDLVEVHKELAVQIYEG